MENGKEIPDQVRNDNGVDGMTCHPEQKKCHPEQKNVILNWIQDL